MGKVVANMSMSLDGFIADPDDQIENLFGWMGNGDVAVPSAVDWVTFQLSAASAEYMRHALDRVGALISGRRLFDITHGWGGKHPMGVPVVVVTHNAPADQPHAENFTFVDGVDKAVAVARTLAGDKDIVVASAKVAQQCLREGLLDSIHVDQVPVLLGEGVRWFENLGRSPIELSGPTVVEGHGVTHLAYDVVRSGRADGASDDGGLFFEEVAEQRTLSVRRTIALTELQQMQGAALTAVWDVLSAHEMAPSGAPFVRYHSFGEDQTDVEVGFPVDTPIVGTGDVRPGVLPGGPVARYCHLGSHNELPGAYQRLEAGIRDCGKTAGSPLWERYEWIDPAVAPDPTAWPPPAEWRTQLVQPLA